MPVSRPTTPVSRASAGRAARRVAWARRLAAAAVAVGSLAAFTVGDVTGASPAGAASAPTPASAGWRSTMVGKVLPGAAKPAAASGPATPYQDSTPYYEVSPSGAVWPLGGAVSHGSLDAAAQHTSVVGVALTPAADGYWMVGANAGVYQYGRAGWWGSPRASGQSMTPAGIVATHNGGGYWVFGQAGRVAAYGNARNFGQITWDVSFPVVDMVATPDDGGYWMVMSDGNVLAFGDARYLGGERGTHIPSPVVAMASTPDGRGYWLVTARGNLYPHGDAWWAGSLGYQAVNQPIASVVPTADGRGYWLVAHDGDLHPFGDATSSAAPVTAFVHKVLTPGDQAVEWAMSQLGKPYVWGGTGPNGFDCSGLTMEAWLHAGVAIPRIADDQYIAEPKSTMANLVDGDLVFWGSSSDPTSIYHVAMYLGGGHMVNAPYTGAVVRTDWIGGYQFVPLGSNP